MIVTQQKRLEVADGDMPPQGSHSPALSGGVTRAAWCWVLPIHQRSQRITAHQLARREVVLHKLRHRLLCHSGDLLHGDFGKPHSGNTTFVRCSQIDCSEPLGQGEVGAVKQRPSRERGLVITLGAFVTVARGDGIAMIMST